MDRREPKPKRFPRKQPVSGKMSFRPPTPTLNPTSNFQIPIIFLSCCLSFLATLSIHSPLAVAPSLLPRTLHHHVPIQYSIYFVGEPHATDSAAFTPVQYGVQSVVPCRSRKRLLAQLGSPSAFWPKASTHTSLPLHLMLLLPP